MRIYDKNIVENKVALFSIFISLRDTYLKVKTLNHMNFLDQIPPKKLNECTRIDFLKAYVFLKNQCINSVPRNINHVSKNVFIIIEGLKEFNQEFSLDLNHVDYKDKLLSSIEEKEDYRYIGLASIIRQILSNEYTIEEKKMSKKLENMTDENIIPKYQPIMESSPDSNEEKLMKYESLVRYLDTKIGKIYEPGEFLPLMEENEKLHKKLTKIMIKKTIEEMSKNKNFNCSINITEYSLNDKETVDYTLKKLKEYKISPNRFTFEILESVRPNYDRIDETIEYIKEKGIQISVDDFGKKHSQFERIKKLKPNFIKLDGYLVKDVTTNRENHALIQFLVKDNPNSKIIAEFVTDKKTLEKLKELGVTYFQGYYFGKPEEQPHTQEQINANIAT